MDNYGFVKRKKTEHHQIVSRLLYPRREIVDKLDTRQCADQFHRLDCFLELSAACLRKGRLLLQILSISALKSTTLCFCLLELSYLR